MKLILLVGSGSFIGGVVRYLVNVVFLNRNIAGYAATFSVNVAGCFLIGFLLGSSYKSNLSSEWQLFLATGILGGFTTFSAFSVEAVDLFRTGSYLSALIYISGTMIAGLIATYSGILVRSL